MDELIEIQKSGYWYLATPYTKYALGLEEAFKISSKIAAELMKRRVSIYSPIAHMHPISLYGNIDQVDHELWMILDKPLLDRSIGLIVATIDGWDNSRGITHEIEQAKKDNKPIRFISWPDLRINNG